MEEEPTSNLLRGMWRRLLWPLLFALAMLLAACGEAPAVESTPLPLTNAISLPQTATTPADTRRPEPTALPVVSFAGVEFAFDEEAFGPLADKSLHSPVATNAESLQPRHLQFSVGATDDLAAPQIYVFPVEEYRALSPIAAQQIDSLTRLLVAQPAEVNGSLPLLPMLGAIASFQTAPTYFDFRNGSGLSYVVRVDHDHSLQTGETLYYTFQGMTANGKYYVAAFFPLAAENLEDGTLDKRKVDAKWVGLPAGVGLPAVESMLETLFVAPDEVLDLGMPPAFVTAPGFMLAYDPELSGGAMLERRPAVVTNGEGAPEFLPAVPDLISVTFDQTASDAATLTIQSIRDENGEYFGDIPAWQREDIRALATAVSDAAAGPPGRLLSFHTGRGLTRVADGRYYFEGLTADGRYVVNLEHPLTAPSGEPILRTYVDALVSSLVIEPHASTESSVPQNQSDCVNEAVFEEDVTVPDRTAVERGETFLKIWRVRNAGTCTWTPAYQIVYAQGNPLSWQPLPLTTVVEPDAVIEVGISVLSPEVPGIYQTWFQLADTHGNPFDMQFLLLFEAPEPATDIPGYGVIEGAINYPASSNPPLDIYIQRTDGSERYAMRTEKGWTRFANAVPVGSYHVFARVAGDESGSGGGFTQAVVCGLHASCDDHTLVVVEVHEGKATKNADIFDWYAPAGSFPFASP